MIITIQHVRNAPTWTSRRGYCASGARAFFIRHGLDWADFLQNGIDSDRLLATGDALAAGLVNWAGQQEAEKHG